MNSKFNLLLKGSGFRVLQTLVGIVIGLLMMPFLIATLGKDLYGLWIVIASITGTYYLLDLGFNQAVTRYTSKYIHQNNPEAANKIINTAVILYSFLGVMVFLIACLSSFYGVDAFVEDKEKISLAQTILIITGLSFALEFPSKAFPGIISAYFRFDFISKVRLTKSVLDAVLIYVFLSNGYGIVAMAFIMLATGVVSALIYVKFSFSLFNELSFKKEYVELDTVKEVYHFSKWVFLLDMAAMLRNKMDIWFIAGLLSTGVLAIYYVAVRLIDYALQFLNQATGITGPIFTEYYAKNETDKLIRSVLLFYKLNIMLGTIIIVGFYYFGNSFIEIWMGDEIDVNEAYICLLILATGRFQQYFSNPLRSYLLTINKHHIDACLSIFELLLTAVFCVFLVPYGIIGAALAITVPYIIGRLLIMPIVVHAFLPIVKPGVALRVLIYWLSTGALSWMVMQAYPELNTLSLLMLLALLPFYLIIHIPIGLVLIEKDELNFLMLKMFKVKRSS